MKETITDLAHLATKKEKKKKRKQEIPETEEQRIEMRGM